MEITTMSRVTLTPALATSRVAPVRLVPPAVAYRQPAAPAPSMPARLARVDVHRPSLVGVGSDCVWGTDQPKGWPAGTGINAMRIDATEKFSTRQGPPSCSPA